MKKFIVKFLREFEVEIQAENTEAASKLAQKVITQFPKDSCKLLSIFAEDYVEPVEDPKPRTPHGKPTGGGSPGTPVVRTEELVDQVAEAA